jgi:hypothetical protein
VALRPCGAAGSQSQEKTMIPSRRCLVLSVALAVWLTFVVRLGAVAPEIKDDGKFFSAEAIKKANEQIREICRKFDKDLLIETYPTPPAGDLDKVKNLSREERTKYFRKWAEERVKERVVNGVYVLICKDPTFLYVDVTSKAQAVFSVKNGLKVRDLLVAAFSEKRFDEGLAEAVRFVQEKLEKSSK